MSVTHAIRPKIEREQKSAGEVPNLGVDESHFDTTAELIVNGTFFEELDSLIFLSRVINELIDTTANILNKLSCF